MEDGLVKPYKIGVPQGGPLSPILSKLYNKIRELLCRRKAAAQPLSLVFTKVNQVVRGWINYFKNWKLPRRIYTNLMRINKALKCNFSDEDIHKVANTQLGWYKRSTGHVVNFLLSPKVLGISKADRPGLVDPLEYYLSRR